MYNDYLDYSIGENIINKQMPIDLFHIQHFDLS